MDQGGHLLFIRLFIRFSRSCANYHRFVLPQPEAIKRYSSPPYLLTFKENGCIIFISALTPTSVVVTSKHSLGKRPATVDSDPSHEDDDEALGASMASMVIDDGGGSSTAVEKASDVSHAEKGSEWLDIHLARVGRTRRQLAKRLWERDETAAFELCDDSFEEHVLAYEKDRSGLHLHGLNSNQVHFKTRDMRELDEFADEWGFIRTRWIQKDSWAEVEKMTSEVGKSGMWEGEPIEGFVVRTRIPNDAPTVADALARAVEEEGKADPSQIKAADRVARPPYEPGQTWFFKVKFDEPYLMYRDWRELTRRMLADQAKWRKEHGSQALEGMLAGTQPKETPAMVKPNLIPGAAPPPASNTASGDEHDPAGPEGKSRKQKKREAKLAAKAAFKQAEAEIKRSAGRDSLPEKPMPRSKRPETLAFVDWCYDRMWGSDDGKVKATPALFASFNYGKGIINVRDRFLDFCRTSEGQKLLKEKGKRDVATAGDVSVEKDDRPYTKTLIVPIAVPGCGKTVLASALRSLDPSVGHTQSDDVQAKKTAAIFLKNIETELRTHDVVIADRNNHLFKHRDEIVELVKRIETEAFAADQPKRGKGTKAEREASASNERPRIRIVAVAWALSALSVNQIHKICAKHIVARGQNHQSLRADGGSGRGPKTHEQVLWMFLKSMQPFGSAQHGEGTDGRGDDRIKDCITLHVDGTLEDNFHVFVDGLRNFLRLPNFTDVQLKQALAHAQEQKVAIIKHVDSPAVRPPTRPRYYGIELDLDSRAVALEALQQLSHEPAATEAKEFVLHLAEGGRIITHPHVTLVHQTNVNAEKSGSQDAHVQGSQVRWQRYEQLSKEVATPVIFKFHLDKLVWDDKVMTFGVRDVHSDQVPDFKELQGGEGGQGQGHWRPHITIGTSNDEIRPYEANRALKDADLSNAKAGAKVKQISLATFAKEITGRLAGLSS